MSSLVLYLRYPYVQSCVVNPQGSPRRDPGREGVVGVSKGLKVVTDNRLSSCLHTEENPLRELDHVFVVIIENNERQFFSQNPQEIGRSV